MNKLPFMDKMEEYQAEYAMNLNKKEAVLNGLRQKVADKQKIIDARQAEYNANPTNDLFEELLTLKRELETLNLNVKHADAIIQVPDIKMVSQEEIAKDVEDVILSLNLDELRSSIKEYKEKFIESINEFEKQLNKITALKEEIKALPVNRGGVHKVLEKYKDLYSCFDEADMSNFNVDMMRRRISEKACRIYIDRTF